MATDSGPSPERQDLHTPAVDESLAKTGRCARVHLPTGRICTREYGHDQSCDFSTPETAASPRTD